VKFISYRKSVKSHSQMKDLNKVNALPKNDVYSSLSVREDSEK
jgi:hypothetical protein